MWHQPYVIAMQSATAVALMPLLMFAAVYVYAAVTYNAFQWAGQPQKLPLPVVYLGPI